MIKYIFYSLLTMSLINVAKIEKEELAAFKKNFSQYIDFLSKECERKAAEGECLQSCKDKLLVYANEVLTAYRCIEIDEKECNKEAAEKRLLDIERIMAEIKNQRLKEQAEEINTRLDKLEERQRRLNELLNR